MGSKNKSSVGFLRKAAEFIVDKRNFIFLIVIAGIIFSAFSIGWVTVQNDLTAFLPDKSDSKAGVDVMMDEFTLFGSAQIMIANISLDQAWDLKEEIEKVDGVQMVMFGDDKTYYNNASACFTVNFSYAQSDARCVNALEEINLLISDRDSYVSSDIGNPMGDILDNEITLIIGVAAVLIVAMLLLTSKSVVEVPVIMLTFVAAMIWNMGTNFIYGEISFVSNSVTSLLQLALSLDYAVIMINRFREEYDRHTLRDAVIEALTKAVPEVFGSSLTTVGGLAAMMCMQFKLGPDMAICLIKAVLLAMLSVFTVMPGLLMIFGKAIKKTEHKSLIPNMSFIGKFAYKSRKIIVPIFIAVIISAMFISHACPFSYGYTDQEAVKMNEQTLAKKMITDNFGSTNMVALVVPGGDYEKEAQLLKELEQCDEVASTMGLANTVAIDGYTLADQLTPRQFSELAGLDYELAGIVYAAYAAAQSDYGAIINDIDSYKVPLIDMFLFVSDQIDSGLVSIEGEQAEMLASAKELMGSAKDMLVGENYDRMVVYLNLPTDGDEAFAFIDKMEDMARGYYDEGDIFIVGNLTTAKDFKESFQVDNIVVSIVSILTVFIVLLLSFKSLVMPIILILIIQGAIWINFSIPTLLDTPLFFLGYIIISAIQMGANIDYAIVIGTRYNEVKVKMSKREAIIDTMSFALPTVITSGTIMSVSGLLIGYMSSEATISSLGMNLGRGTIISMILVLFVLPQFLLLGDKLVDKTSFSIFKKKKNEKTAEGTLRLCGQVSGEIYGRIDGLVDGVVDGSVNLTIKSGEINEITEGKEDEK